MLIARRAMISGILGVIAAPAIVRASSIMPVKRHGDYLRDVLKTAWTNGGNPTTVMVGRYQSDFGEWMVIKTVIISPPHPLPFQTCEALQDLASPAEPPAIPTNLARVDDAWGNPVSI